MTETLEPLGALNLERTKTQVPRYIPVHPTLARILAEWKLAGWERAYDRAPNPEDLIVPTRNLTERPSPDAQHALLLDLAALNIRPRRGHDLRRTFITLAQVDGARRDLLETITHGPRGDIINVYTTFPWPALCAEVQKLNVSVREGQVLDGDFRGLATSQRNRRNRWKKTATPGGQSRSDTRHAEVSGITWASNVVHAQVPCRVRVRAGTGFRWKVHTRVRDHARP